MTKTKPDNVADNPALLPYGSNVGAPSILRLTRRAAALAKLLPIFALSCPRKAARLKWKVPRFDCAG